MTDTTGYNIRPLLAGLVDAGFISESRDVERVIIDIEGGCSPQVYVQYAGDPDKLTAVLGHIARSMPIVETSAPRPMSADDLLRAGNYVDDRGEPVRPATHREDALGYAAAVEQQRRTTTGGTDE